jgi:hypothetical protein
MRTLCTLIFLPSLVAVHAQVPADATTLDLPDLMVGTWEGPLGDALYREEWVQVTEGTYEGSASMVQDGKVINEEHMRLTFLADHWVFMASTGGGRITSFVRKEEKDGVWIFENKEHDFPQRIGYQVQGDTLRAYIAKVDDRTDRMDFVLKRVK